MKTLVTGATGFVGQHLVKKVLEEEGQIRVLLRKRSSLPVLRDKRVEISYGDLTVKESLWDIAQGIDVVINVAGTIGKWGVSREELFHGNVSSVKHLLEVCSSANIQHFIHLSTCGVSGPLEGDGANEDSPCYPYSPYEKTKYQGEILALEMAARYKIPLTIIRPTFTYGPGDLRRLPLFRMIKKGLFVFLGDGRGTLHPVYIDDLIRGIMLCKTHAPSNSIYIIGGAEVVTIKELVSCLAQILDVKQPYWHLPLFIAWPTALALEMAGKVARFDPPLTRSRLALFTQHHGYCIARARRELGYHQKIGLYQGMERTIKWYKEQGYL